jgi:hypothetical protein
MPNCSKYILHGTGMAAGALLSAWFLNAVFERTWGAIALILLAMLTVMLIRRMVEGGIPESTVPVDRREESSDKTPEQPPRIHEEAKHLSGVDHRYGWMALPPAVTALVVLVSIFI